MTVEFRIGDVRKLLAEVPDGSVDLIATSWPYLAQRSYLPADHPMKAFEIGQESTPTEFIQTLLEVTAEFRRVLAPHGSIATELGDGFSGSGGAGGDCNANGLREGQQKFDGSGRKRIQKGNGRDWPQTPGLNFKESRDGWPLGRSLVMAPELYRVALAYGIHPLTGEPSPAGRWRVRNVVVHGRPNPPVGALGDKWRPACSTWAVACTSRRWFDLDAVRTPASGYQRVNSAARATAPGQKPRAVLDTTNPAGAPPLDWIDDQFDEDLWTLPTSPYPGSHYSTFSPELIRRFIVSMCPARVCRVCGKPSVRLTNSQVLLDGQPVVSPGRFGGSTGGVAWKSGVGVDHNRYTTRRETLGWSDCGCPGDHWRPGLVLDPFGGSGTTGMVAAGNGRDALLFDLDERCEALARERIGLYLAEQARPEPQAEPISSHQPARPSTRPSRRRSSRPRSSGWPA